MARQNAPLFSFNRGEVAKTALARVDLERLRLSAEEQINWLPTVLGPMMLRPGLQLVGGIRNDLKARYLPFVFSTTDLALLELTASKLRIWTVDPGADTETLVTRANVSTTVTNGDFSSATGWTLVESGDGAAADIAGGKLTLASPAIGGLAQAKRTVTVAGGDLNKVHGFRIVVDRGPIRFRAGSTDGAEDVLAQVTLDTGTHSLAFTPASSPIYIEIETITAQQKIVDSIAIDAAGALELPTPWAEDDLPLIRYAGSGDIVFVACYGQQQRKIERRSTDSWSVVLYQSDDGPFAAVNVTDTTLAPAALSGNTTLTPSRPVFSDDHAGALFRLFSSGQRAEATLAATSAATSTIRVTGVGSDRTFTYSIAGTWAGTIAIERSIESADSGFSEVTTFTSNTTSTYNDSFNNIVAWYRLVFKSRVSGSANVSLAYSSGGAAGIGRVTSIFKPEYVTNGAFAADTDWNKGTGWSIAAGVASSNGTQAANSDLTNVSNNNIATNGTFATDTDWSKGTGWSISAGAASCDGSQTDITGLGQTSDEIVVGASYVVTFTITAYSAGSITPTIGATLGTARSAAGTYTETIVAGSGHGLGFDASTLFVGTIDNVVVQSLYVASLIPGSSYIVAFTVSNYSAGSVAAVLGGGTAGASRAANGTYSEVLRAGSNGSIVMRADADFVGSIDNFSVKPVADVANVEVLKPFSSLTATADWNEGDWSTLKGWPSAVQFYDGHLWWAGRDRLWGSVSDAYYSHDIDVEGDSAAINRSVGFGPVDTINWLLDLSRLIVGREGAETSVRSGSFDEPLTPTNFTLKDCSTQGSARIPAVKIDTRGVFVQRSGRRVYELGFSIDAQDYVSRDLTRLNPDIGRHGFVDVAVQRQPDTQLGLVRGDGMLAALAHDVEDQVEAWWRVDTAGDVDGVIEATVVLPGPSEDRAYYAVKRTINGQTKRFLERAARRDQCTGRPEARLSDSHVIYTGGTTTVTGLSHLEGEEVVAWGWDNDGEEGSDCGTGLDAAGAMVTLTVTGGQVTIPEAFDNVCVGLPYQARFKSAKLAYAAQMGTALNQKKKLNRLGLSLTDTHWQGLRFGSSFTRMDGLPRVIGGAEVAAGTVHEDLDLPMLPNPGGWDTDSRLCLLAASPRPATVRSTVVDVTTNETP